MRKLAAALLLSTLAACASARWTKPGATQADFAADKWRCLRDAQALNENATWSRGITTKRIFAECMADHGWSAE
jgi:hypothetical protein